MRRLTGSTSLGSLELTGTEPMAGNLPGMDLGTLHMCGLVQFGTLGGWNRGCL